jgi:hypothetical protein
MNVGLSCVHFYLKKGSKIIYNIYRLDRYIFIIQMPLSIVFIFCYLIHNKLNVFKKKQNIISIQNYFYKRFGQTKHNCSLTTNLLQIEIDTKVIK